MKRRWTAALLALLLLALCGCASRGQESAEVSAALPEQSAAPETETADVPAATEAPAPAASEAPKLSAAAEPTKTETAEPSPTETPEPAEDEEIKLTTHWQMAYEALLKDPALLDQVIGQNGDYRKEIGRAHV